jgi:hypothetical protein
MSVYCALKEWAICFTGSLSDHIMGGFETSDTEKLLMLDAEAVLEMLVFFFLWGWRVGPQYFSPKKADSFLGGSVRARAIEANTPSGLSVNKVIHID